MKRWLPRFYLAETMLCDRDGESEGWQFCLAWHGVTIELTVARRTRAVR